MEDLKKAYEAIEMLEALGLPISEEQYAAIAKLEKEFILEQVLPQIKQQVEPLIGNIKDDFRIVLSYSHKDGLNVSLAGEPRVKDGASTPRTKQYIIKVEFPDGHSVCHRKVYKTLIDVIEYAGVERVRSLNIMTVTGNIISDEVVNHVRYGKKQKRLASGSYVQTHSDTDGKFRQINEINKRLGLGLVVSKVIPSTSLEEIE